jgi:hypothetical protein
VSTLAYILSRFQGCDITGSDIKEVNQCSDRRFGDVQLEMAEAWEDEIDDIISRFEKQHRRRLMYTIRFY